MIVPFNPADTASFYDEYYSQQAGNGLAVFSGRRIMDGDGIGSFLSGVFKASQPLLKNVAKSALKTVGKQALNVVGDVVAGKGLRESALGGLKNAGGEIMGDVFRAVSRGDESSGARRRANKRKNKSRGGGGKRSRESKTIFN